MSDDNSDAEFEASLANLDVSGFEDSGDQLPGTADPELASRIDSLHATMSTLGMRLDALVTSTTTYRSTLTDRLTEYADLVTKLTRSQTADLEEYRRANERTVAELRRSLGTSEEVLERVGARIDSMLTETESSDDSARRMLAEVRSILDAQESLGRFITDSLDQFADRVTDRMAGSQQTAASQLSALQSTLDAVAQTISSETGQVGTVLGELQETMLDVASGEVVGALWDEVRGIRNTVDELASRALAIAGTVEDISSRDDSSATAEVIEAVRAEVAAVRRDLADAVTAGEVDESEAEASQAALRADVTALASAVRDLLDQAEIVDEDAPEPMGGGMLTAVAADVAHLRSELSQGLIVEPSEALAGTVDELRADLAELRERMQVLADLEVAIDGLSTPAQSAPAGDADQLAAVRAGIEDIIARLDEGLVLADDELTPPAAALSPAVVDQLAALKDQIATEFDALRSTPKRATDDSGPSAGELANDELASITELLEHVRDDLAELPERIAASAPAPTAAGEAPGAGSADADYVTIDPDSIDLLREEIRNAGASAGASTSDEVLEALTKELKSLRRRIRLRAEGEIFSQADLETIAAAVARKLAD